MFGATKYAFDNELLFHIKDGMKWHYWEPEINITMAYLMAKYPNEFNNISGPELMVQNFDIFNLLSKCCIYKIITIPV